VRERTPGEGGVQQAGQSDVVEEAAPARQEPGILDALDAGAG